MFSNISIFLFNFISNLLISRRPGTDGQDGDSDVAGAFANWGTVKRARKMGMVAEDYLANNDSFTFFHRLGENFKTGLTGTNVMDIYVLLIKPKVNKRLSPSTPR